jgi:NAD(P)-dependent dehydrogenase (short-subunit alcohol dehydrogenase family)
MKNEILVAGGTGDLGNRIIKALLKRNANVVAIVRHSSDNLKVEELEKLGVKILKVDMTNVIELSEAMKDTACVVSALAGLRETIVDAQSILLEAAVAVGVTRFIPSDYSSDITQVAEGENRNFDLRKEFHRKLEATSIKATSIMNGAFADILFYNTPFYNLKDNSVGYWGNDADFKVDFTTKDDTAAFTAAAALDENTPRILRIASFQVSANDLVAMGSKIKNIDFKLIPMGSVEDLSAHNKKARAENPDGENELYPKWQGSQYMHSMFTAQNVPLDNNLYEGLTWTSAEAVFGNI